VVQFLKYVNKKNKVKSKQKLNNYQIFPFTHKATKHEESSPIQKLPIQKLPNLKHANNMLNGIIQTKLKVSNPSDKYEKEAEQIAQKITSNKQSNVTISKIQDNTIRRISNDSKQSEIETKITSASGGHHLNSSTNKSMSERIGYDFSNVKIHNDSNSRNLAESVNARAFTYGNDVYFGKNESESDEKVLAHELVHVVQQNDDHIQRKIIQRIPKVYNERPNGTLPRINYDIRSRPTKFWIRQNGRKAYTLTQTESYGVEAWVRPANYESGTRTNNAVRGTARAAKELFGKSFVAGHMLNHYLGGDGHSYRNITAFTSKANSRHLHGIEKQAKAEVKTDKHAIKYQVWIDHVKDHENNARTKGVENLADHMKGAYWIEQTNGELAPGKQLSLDLAPDAIAEFDKEWVLTEQAQSWINANGTPDGQDTADYHLLHESIAEALVAVEAGDISNAIPAIKELLEDGGAHPAFVNDVGRWISTVK